MNENSRSNVLEQIQSESVIITSTPAAKRRKSREGSFEEADHFCNARCLKLSKIAPVPTSVNDTYFLGGECSANYVVSRTEYQKMVEKAKHDIQKVALKILVYLFDIEELQASSISGGPHVYRGNIVRSEKLCPVRMTILKRQFAITFCQEGTVHAHLPKAVAEAINTKCRGLRQQD